MTDAEQIEALTTGIYHGDALALIPLLPDNSVDLVLTDPPSYSVAGRIGYEMPRLREAQEDSQTRSVYQVSPRARQRGDTRVEAGEPRAQPTTGSGAQAAGASGRYRLRRATACGQASPRREGGPERAPEDARAAREGAALPTTLPLARGRAGASPSAGRRPARAEAWRSGETGLVRTVRQEAWQGGGRQEPHPRRSLPRLRQGQLPQRAVDLRDL